jgi:hypothetical protein
MWAATYLQVGALPNYCDAFLYSLNAMTTYGHAGLYLEKHWQFLGGVRSAGWDVAVWSDHRLSLRYHPEDSMNSKADAGQDLRKRQSTIPVHTTPLKPVSRPQCPIVEIAPWLCLLQELAGIKNSVIGLEPDVRIHLPTHFDTGPLAHEPSTTASGGPDQGSRHGIHTIQQALSPIENPIGRDSHPMPPLG